MADISIDEFRDEVTTFLDANAERRAETQAKEFTWGEGSDDVALFDYQWTLPPVLADDFTGTVLDSTRWLASSTGVTQDGKATLVGAGNWGNRYLFSAENFGRDNLVFQARVTPLNTTGNPNAPCRPA